MKYLLFIFIFVQYIVLPNEWVYVQNTNTQAVFSYAPICCPDSNNCFALSQQSDFARLYKSTDGGITWKIIFETDPWNEGKPYLINSHWGYSPHSDYYFMVMEDYPVIKKSWNGGKTFKNIFLDTMDTKPWRQLGKLSMYNMKIGFIANADFDFFTEDGWETFEKIKKNTPDERKSSYFINDTIILISAFHNIEGYYHIDKYNIKNKKLMTLYEFPGDTETEYAHKIFDLYFINDTLGFGCGIQYENLELNSRYGIIYRTTDGGYTWKLQLKELEGFHGGFRDIAFADSKNGIAVGEVGKIYMTNDSGNTWILNEVPEKMENATDLRVAWAGQTPLIATAAYEGGIFRYEGDFFDFSSEPQDTTISLIYTIPTAEEDSVSINTEIYAKFDDILDTSKFTDNSYTLRNISNNDEYIKGAFHFDFADSTLRFTPDSSLPYQSVIRVNFYNIYDIAGNVLSNYEYIFTTEPDSSVDVVDDNIFQSDKITVSLGQNSSELRILIQNPKFRKYNLQIYDIIGNIVLQQELQSGIGTLYKSIDISGLSPGAYLWMISANGILIKTGKIISITN